MAYGLCDCICWASPPPVFWSFSSILMFLQLLQKTKQKSNSPKSKNIRLFGEGKLVLLCVGGELLDELGGQVAEPAIGDQQFVFSPAAKTPTHRTFHSAASLRSTIVEIKEGL